MDEVSQVKLKGNSTELDEKAIKLESLIEQYDVILVETTLKRKTYPQQIRSNLAKEYNFRVDHLKQFKFRETSAPKLFVEKLTEKFGESLLKEEALNSAQNTFTKLASLSKSVPALAERAQGLKKSQELYASLAHCPTHRVIMCPEDGEDKMASSVTPLRNRLAHPYRTPPARVKRSALIHPKQSPVNGMVKTDYKPITSSHRLSRRLSNT